MGEFAVYNIHDSIEAKNLFAMQSEDDILSDVYKCSCVVHVENAFLGEVYQGYGHLRKRELVLQGSVTSAFIEDREDMAGVFFPCDSKFLRMMTPQDVTVHWVLSLEEAALIEGMGCTYEDFELPPNLIGNDIEIPMNIKYYGIYESPVVAIEVLDADNVPTCTKENQYFGFFQTCVPSAQVEAQKLEDYEFYPEPEYLKNEDVPMYGEFEEEVESQIESEPSVEDEEEDAASYDAVNRLIEQQAAEAEEKRAKREAHSNETKSIVGMVNARLAEAARKEEDNNSTNIWDTMYDDTQTENKTVKHKPSYDDFKEAAILFEQEKAERDKRNSDDSAAQVDTAMDNMLLNEGITDIAGYNSSAETTEQVQEKKDQKSGKKAIESARRQDIAADNKALNEGITDIAGQGAAEAMPVKPGKVDASAQALVANLFGITPNNNAQVSSVSDDDDRSL